jgi:hypothetical protein
MIRPAALVACAMAWFAAEAHGADAVTVIYRGHTYGFTGRDAERLTAAALRLLTGSRTERPLAGNDNLRRHLETARERSCIRFRFATPRSIPKTGTAAAGIAVEELIIPFSPDLDPQAVFVLPGRPARAFTDFRIVECDDLRTMLVHARIYPAVPGAVIRGVVRVTGKPPPPRTWEVDLAIKRTFGLTRYTEETWQVGPKGELRNCVITLRDRRPDRRMVPRPLQKATISKDMVRYDPHVLVVTPDTPVTLDNPDSPCNGFQIMGSRPLTGNQYSYRVVAGTEQTVRLRGPDLCSVTCPVRPYAQGYIHVVDTRYFATTDADGRFTIRGVPEGDYEVSVWHEAVGRLGKDAGPTQVATAGRGEHTLVYKVAVPAKGDK